GGCSMKMMFPGVVATFVLVLALSFSGAGQKDKKDEKPEYKISEVMQKAHKGGLMKKVAEGKASDEEKQQMVKYYTALNLSTPPAGLREDWQKKTAILLDAAKAAAKGDENAAKSLLKL